MNEHIKKALQKLTSALQDDSVRGKDFWVARAIDELSKGIK